MLALMLGKTKLQQQRKANNKNSVKEIKISKKIYIICLVEGVFYKLPSVFQK